METSLWFISGRVHLDPAAYISIVNRREVSFNLYYLCIQTQYLIHQIIWGKTRDIPKQVNNPTSMFRYLFPSITSRTSSSSFLFSEVFSGVDTSGEKGTDLFFNIFEPSYMYLEDFPIRTIDFSDPADKARRDRMIELVNRMLDLNKQLPEAKTPQTKTVLQRQSETTDR